MVGGSRDSNAVYRAWESVGERACGKLPWEVARGLFEPGSIWEFAGRWNNGAGNIMRNGRTVRWDIRRPRRMRGNSTQSCGSLRSPPLRVENQMNWQSLTLKPVHFPGSGHGRRFSRRQSQLARLRHCSRRRRTNNPRTFHNGSGHRRQRGSPALPLPKNLEVKVNARPKFTLG